MSINSLISLGLSLNESRIYLILVECGKLSAYAIAKRTKLPRSTVYSVLGTLEEKSLIRQEQVRGVFAYRVDNPEDLFSLLEREERMLTERRKTAKVVVQELCQRFKSKSYQPPRLEFYEGKERVEKFLDANLPIWIESILECDRSTWGYQDHTFVSEFNPWIKRCWKVMHEDNQISGRILSNRSDIERSLRGRIARREVRVLGEEFSFKSSIWIMGEFVISILTREPPIIAYQIHNRTLADNLRLVFRFLYEQGSAEL